MLGCIQVSEPFVYKFESLRDRISKWQAIGNQMVRGSKWKGIKMNILKWFTVIGVWLLAMHVGVLFVSLLHFILSLYQWRCFQGGLTAKWIKWGLLTEYISNLRACNCGLRHLQGLWLLLRLWIHQALPAPFFSCYSDVEEERGRKARGKRKELLITCFVWSESPCKYMNSKCRKSNLVAHWYILLFAYLPAPVVSSCISGLGTSNTQWYAYIFFLFFCNCVFIFSILPPPFVSFSILSISTLLYPPPHLPFTSPIPFPQSPSDIRVYFPPGRMHDRGAGGTESKWQISLSPSLPAPLSLSISPTVLPEALLSLPSSLLPAPSHPIWPHWYSNLPRLHSTFSRCEGLAKPPREKQGGLMSPPWFLIHG